MQSVPVLVCNLWKSHIVYSGSDTMQINAPSMNNHDILAQVQTCDSSNSDFLLDGREWKQLFNLSGNVYAVFFTIKPLIHCVQVWFKVYYTIYSKSICFIPQFLFFQKVNLVKWIHVEIPLICFLSLGLFCKSQCRNKYATTVLLPGCMEITLTQCVIWITLQRIASTQ